MDAISWGEFLKGLGAVLVFYYAYVFIRFLPSDFRDLIRKLNSKGSINLITDSYISVLDKMAELISRIDREIIPVCKTEEEFIEQFRLRLLRSGLPDSPAVRRILTGHVLLAAKLRELSLSEDQLIVLLDGSLNS